ncbi:MAG TPA: 8-amino-7-oxononanoate synthase [Micromonosporaceae bacterium]
MTGPVGWLAALHRSAADRERAGLRRALRPRPPGDATVDLAGNDYLGLARHPVVLGEAERALRGYGLGATGSRLVRGSTDAHRQLEDGLADWLGTESALVFSSGYLANLAAVRALAGPGTVIVSDAHAHASLIDGCRISRAPVTVSRHADPAAVAEILAGYQPADGAASDPGDPGYRALVVTESVFSVDGDLAPLGELHAVCRRYGALLLVDDAHALGVLGPRGAGGVAAAGLAGQPDVVVTATLSKAFGAAGGLVAGPRPLIEHLVDTGRTFIFDTALPPAVAAGALAALRLLRDADAARAELVDRATLLVKRMVDAGLEVTQPAGGIISVTAPSPQAAVAWAAACRERGVAVGCFRPPSTPDSRARLRLTVNTGVPRDDFLRALDVIVECAP